MTMTSEFNTKTVIFIGHVKPREFEGAIEWPESCGHSIVGHLDNSRVIFRVDLEVDNTVQDPANAYRLLLTPMPVTKEA